MKRTTGPARSGRGRGGDEALADVVPIGSAVTPYSSDPAEDRVPVIRFGPQATDGDIGW